MPRNFPLLLLLIFLLSIQGCAQTGGNTTSDQILLGAIYNLSGSQAALDFPSAQGARLAVTQANRAGGVQGQAVRLILENSESRSELVKHKTAAVLDEFPSISALLGLSDTDMVLAAAPVAAVRQRLFLTSGATSPLLPQQVPEYLFMACFGDNVQAAAGAQWAYHELSIRNAVVLFNAENSYTRLLQEYFQESFRQLGGRIVASESYHSSDMGPAIARLGKAELVYVAAETAEEAFQAVKLLRQAGFSIPILGGDSFDAVKFWSKHPHVKQVFFSTHAYLGEDNPNVKVSAFRKAYKRAYSGSEPDAFSALGYDAVRLLLEAVKQAQSTQADKVLNALAGIRYFEGVSGSMSFSEGSRIPVKSVSILGIEHGRFKLIRQIIPNFVPVP